MASIKCPRCWKQVPPQAAFCPRCGCSLRPLPRGVTQPKRRGVGGRALIFLAVLVGLWSYASWRGADRSSRRPASTEYRDGTRKIVTPSLRGVDVNERAVKTAEPADEFWRGEDWDSPNSRTDVERGRPTNPYRRIRERDRNDGRDARDDEQPER